MTAGEQGGTDHVRPLPAYGIPQDPSGARLVAVELCVALHPPASLTRGQVAQASPFSLTL